MVFAALILVLFAGIGVAVDYNRVEAARQDLQRVVDSATLAASKAGSSGTEFGLAAAQSAGAAAAKSQEISFVSGTPDVTFTESGGVLVGRGTAKVDLTLSKLLHVATLPISAEAAVAESRNFLEVNLVLDVSESMNIAATPAEIDRLNALTFPYTSTSTDLYVASLKGCAFGCHLPHGSGFEPAGETMQSFARKNGVKLRADVMREAAKNLSNSVLGRPGGGTTVGVYQFSATLAQALAPSDNPATVATAIDSQAVPSDDTLLEFRFPTLTTQIGSGGRGASASSPEKVAVIITDGAMGIRAPKLPLSAGVCDDLKKNGVKVAVIYIKQFELPDDPTYRDWVAPRLPEMQIGMQDCASPGLYFEAQDAAEVAKAFEDATGRLTAGDLRLVR